MRAEALLHREFDRCLEQVHQGRRHGVFAAVSALIRCGRSSLTHIGRAIAEDTSQKHGIKRVDRLLGNTHLHEERLTFYRALARKLIGTNQNPRLVIDWTSVTPEIWAIVAALVFNGRALIVYAESHTIDRYAHPAVHRRFLARLRSVLPSSCRPIVIADAGFRAPFMKLVDSFRWDYVIRVRGPISVRLKADGDWQPFVQLFAHARQSPRAIGRVFLGRSHCSVRYAARLIATRQRTSKRPYRARGIHDPETHRRSAREPWILATSLDADATQIVAVYKQRMQIEETFRDAKNAQYGLSLSHARTRSTARADVLVMVTALAHFVCTLVGLLAETAGVHSKFQANTAKHRVLSHAKLGRLIINECGGKLLRLRKTTTDGLLRTMQLQETG